MDKQLFNTNLKSLNKLPEPKEWSLNSIGYFELDLGIYSNIFSNSARIKQNIGEYKEVIKTIEKLSEDIYLCLFKVNPEVKDVEEISPLYRLNNMLIKKLLETDEFQDLRSSCSLNYFRSILGTEFINKEIVSNFKQISSSNAEFSNLLKQYDRNVNNYEEKSLRLQSLYSLFDRTRSETTKVEIERLIDLTNAIETRIVDNIEGISEIISLENILYKGSSNAYKEFIATSNTIKSWGLDDGKLTPTSYDEKIEVSLKLRSLKKVKDISEMAGRFKRSASNLQKRKTKEEGQEICGVELGNEVHKVLPSEKILLANASTKKGFYKKYIQNELLSYKYKNNKAKSKGPIICCIDTSASMEGELEVWSKSLAITLLDIAVKQGRDFIAIMFSNKVYKVIEFNKSRIEPKKLYELATFFYGSGTNFIEPLNECVRLMNTVKYKYSDIVFITDGEAPLDKEFVGDFLAHKKKKEFRMITVNVSDKVEEALNEINDIQILLKDLNEETIEDANETIFTI
jgi:uncharacterized protein with von Willebrand factor type A (vWA) domain